MSDSSIVDPLKDPNASITQPRRGKGAPIGNKNAIRHGFYARNLSSVSPAKFDETELRNLMGEVAMLKDYMYLLYNKNVESNDPIVINETLKALSMAGMAVSRLLLVHNQIRLTRSSPGSNSTLKELLADMNAATSRAGHITASVNRSISTDEDL